MARLPENAIGSGDDDLRNFGPIILADDDPDDREMVIAALTEVGYEGKVAEATDGVELMRALRAKTDTDEELLHPRPQLVLLDLNMPRMSGREALVEIKSDPRLKTIPVVVLSTSVAQRYVLESYAAGVNAYFAKPVKYSELVGIIRRIVLYWSKTVKVEE